MKLFSKSHAVGLATVLALATISAPVTAQEFELDPIVIVTPLLAQPLSDVLPSVTVVSRQDIEKSQATSIADLLQGEPGFEFGRDGGVGTTTSFFLRGENSVSMAIYVDGVKAQTDGYGNVEAVNIPLAMIEKIEIIRGNAGALYGEAAIGGVINITTRKGGSGTPKAYASVTYGSRSTYDTTAGYGGQVDRTKFNLAVNGSGTNGFSTLNTSQYPSANPNTGAFSSQSIHGTVSRLLTDDLEVGALIKYLTSNIAYADPNAGPCTYCDGTGPTTTFNMKTTSTDLTAFAKYNVNSNWDTRLDITQSDLIYDLYSNADIAQLTTTFGYNPLLGITDYSPHSSQTSGRWFNTYRLDEGQTFIFGLDDTQAAFNNGQGDRMSRDSLGYFAGYNQRVGKLDIQINGRHDDINVTEPDSNYGTRNYQASTGLFGLGYHLTDNVKLTGTASSGFRAPSVGEIFGYPAAGYPAQPNFNLTPETHHSQEVGIVYTLTDLMSRLVYFDTKTNNAITYQPANNTYINLPTISNHGYELTGNAKIQGVNVKIAYTIQNPVDLSGAPVLRRAKDFGSLDLEKPVGDYSVGTKVLYSGSRPDSYYDPATGNSSYVTLGSYQIWNFYASKKIDDAWTARIKLANAFNEKYQLAYGYNTEPRSIYFTLNYQSK